MSLVFTDFLRVGIVRLESDAGMINILGEKEPGKAKVWNNVPQDTAYPFVELQWDQVGQWDTKTEHGVVGNYVIQGVSNQHGDKECLEIMQAVDNALHNKEFNSDDPPVVANGTSVLLQHLSHDIIKQPNGVRRIEMRYRAIFST